MLVRRIDLPSDGSYLVGKNFFITATLAFQVVNSIYAAMSRLASTTKMRMRIKEELAQVKKSMKVFSAC